MEIGTRVINCFLAAFKCGFGITEDEFEIILRSEVEAFDLEETLGECFAGLIETTDNVSFRTVSIIGGYFLGVAAV